MNGSVCRVLVFVVPVLARTASATQVLYRETFDHAGSQLAVTALGWTAVYGNTDTPAAVAAVGATGIPANAMISGGPSARASDGAGGYTFPPDVNAGPPGPFPSTAGGYTPYSRGFLTHPVNGGLYDMFVYTNEYVIDRSLYTLESISFHATSSGTYTTADRDRVHVMLQIDGQWYQSADGVVPPMQTSGAGSAFQMEAIEIPIAVDTAAANWRPFTGVLGIPFAAGPPGSLPSGHVTGFGLYWDLAATSDRNTPRWDTFTVRGTLIPEPACLMLLATLGSGVCRRSRGAVWVR